MYIIGFFMGLAHAYMHIIIKLLAHYSMKHCLFSNILQDLGISGDKNGEMHNLNNTKAPVCALL